MMFSIGQQLAEDPEGGSHLLNELAASAAPIKPASATRSAQAHPQAKTAARAPPPASNLEWAAEFGGPASMLRLQQPVVSCRGRHFENAWGESNLPSPAPPLTGVHLPAMDPVMVRRRMLSPIWSTALADGWKFVEIQRYRKHAGNQMRWSCCCLARPGARSIRGLRTVLQKLPAPPNLLYQQTAYHPIYTPSILTCIQP